MLFEILSKISIISLIFYQILYLTVIGSIVGVIVLLIRNIFDSKISGKWKCFMWGIVLVVFVVPIRFEIQDIKPVIQNEFVSKIETIKSIPDYNKSVIYEKSLNDEAAKFNNISDNIEKEETKSNEKIEMKLPLKYIFINIVIPCIWLFGIIGFTVSFFYETLKIKKRIKKSIYKDPNLEKLLLYCKNQLHIKKEINLVLQNYKRVPSIFGVLNPVILITKRFFLEEERTVKYIFLHELSHYKRKDLLFNYVLLFILSIHWFNPIVWVLFKKIRQDMEIATDELATYKLNNREKKEYGLVLINLLRHNIKEGYTANMLCMSDTGKNMERRIRMIKGKSKSMIISAILVVLVIVIIAGVVFVKNVEKESFSNIEKVNSNSIIDEKANKDVNISEENNSIEEENYSNVVKDDEKAKIEEYVNKVCHPRLSHKIDEFNDINLADKSWIYAHLSEIDDVSVWNSNMLSKEQIEEQLHKLFGRNLVIDVEKDIKTIDNHAVITNSELFGVANKYALPIYGMSSNVYYYINSIMKEKGNYVVNVTEFDVYVDVIVDLYKPEEEIFIISKYNEKIKDSWKWEEVLRMKGDDLDKVSQKPNPAIVRKVLNQKDDFDSYNIILEKLEDGEFYVKEIKKCLK